MRWHRILTLSLGFSALVALALIAIPATDWLVMKWHGHSEDHTPVVATNSETRSILQAILKQPDSELLQGIPPPPPLPRKPGDPQRITSYQPITNNRTLILLDKSICFSKLRDSGCMPSEKWKILDASLRSSAPRKLHFDLIDANQSATQLDLTGIKQIRVVQSLAIKKPPKGGWWQGFYQAYPDTSGYARITRPVLSNDREQALIYIEHHCDGLCGTGRIYALARSESGWEVRESILLWIS